MEQSEAAESHPGLSGLSWKTWLMLVLGQSAMGSQLAVLILLAIHSLYAGEKGADVVISAFWPPMLFQLSYVFLLSLIVNLCGALALLAIFAIRRRLKRN